jgi:hypothetical protein
MDALRTDQLMMQLGWLQSHVVAGVDEIAQAEFKVFSQWGEDGIIQFLVQRIPIDEETFVELGVEDYTESNTRFLLVKDNWKGLIVDANSAHEHFLETSGLAWQHDITALTAFLDRENAGSLIAGAGFEGDIGLLSIDLDGNDYWILEALDVLRPRILIVEYNSNFGPDAEISIPYDEAFDRHQGHYSGLYWGASLGAFARLADSREYGLVCCGTAGINAFFVRRDVLGSIPERSVGQAYVRSRVRDTRDPSGSLTYIGSHQERLRLIGDLPVIDVSTGETTTVAERVRPMPDG